MTGKQVPCPSCNTMFLEDNAPWLKQVEYCAKHDRVRLAGTKCEFCEAEGEPVAAKSKTCEAEGEPVAAKSKTCEAEGEPVAAKSKTGR